MLSEFQSIVPDIYIGEDGQLRLLLDVVSGSVEGIYIAAQIISEDMFIQTASLSALLRYGEMFGIPRKGGTKSTGLVKFLGTGGTFIPTGSEVVYDPGGGIEPLVYLTTAEGTISNPGIPTAPTAADGGAGALAAGTYEYVITFEVDDGDHEGETLAGPESNALVLGASKRISLTNIPTGGIGTTSRYIYRRVNGGVWKLVEHLLDNATTTYDDNTVTGSLVSQEPPFVGQGEFVYTEIEAEAAGFAYNVGTNTIITLSDVPDGVTEVTNVEATVGGADEEDTEIYRQRMLEAVRAPGTGSPTDIKVWSEAIEGVETATVYPNENMGAAANGHVTVLIVGTGGTIADSELIDLVLDELQAKDIATITIHVGTYTAQPEDVTVDVTLAPEYVMDDVEAQVITAITNYINGLDVEATMYISGIVDAVFGLVGILDVDVTTPATNQTAASGTKITPGTITVT